MTLDLCARGHWSRSEFVQVKLVVVTDAVWHLSYTCTDIKHEQLIVSGFISGQDTLLFCLLDLAKPCASCVLCLCFDYVTLLQARDATSGFPAQT